MSIKKEATGRRSVEVEIEVPGTPEEVWQAIATGPGISSWFVPAEFEIRDGVPVAVTLNFGPGMDSRSEVTSWEPLKKWATQSDGWAPGMPSIGNEWSIETRDGGVCIVRIVHSMFASTDDWDDQLEATESGWPAFFATLRIYLTHFRNQPSSVTKLMAPFEGSMSEAWESLTSALSLTGKKIGQKWSAPAGVPTCNGVVEYATQDPYNVLIRIDNPGGGITAVGAFNCGGPSMVAMSLYQYGEQAADVAAQEEPQWQTWFQEQFSKGVSMTDGLPVK